MSPRGRRDRIWCPIKESTFSQGDPLSCVMKPELLYLHFDVLGCIIIFPMFKSYGRMQSVYGGMVDR